MVPVSPPIARRIALVIGSLQGGGAERVAGILAQGWRGRGHAVDLVTLEPADAVPAYGLDPGLRVLRLDGSRPARNRLQALGRELANVRKLGRALRELRPDVVVSFLDQTNVLTLLACLGSGLPVVVSERSHPGRQPLGRAWRLLRRLTHPLAAALVVQTPEIGRWCRRFNTNIRVIPNPVLPAPEIAGPGSGPVLLAAGRLSREKGFDILIRAFALLASRHPQWNLHIHGEGPQLGALEALVRSLRLTDRVALPGWVPDLAARMAQARIFVLASRWEGFPNALCEAMAAGLACVAADCPGGGPAAIIRQEKDGLLVPPDDVPALAGALDRLVSDQELRARLGLGHRRLAVLELSPLGDQPMLSACGRYVLTFNGEIYNHAELRSELASLGHVFQGGSDTEALLAAVSQWGLERACGRLVGMFAFGLWDRQERRLFLVRDRLGVKPLYYGRAGDSFVFGSELKALRAAPGFSPDLDRNALALYFRHNYIPAPWTIYRAARKLEPGRILHIDVPDQEPVVTVYWSARDVWDQGARAPFAGTLTEAVDRLEGLLDQAVRLRMAADVPVCALLSGGVDSSTVTALLQRAASRPVRTFSLGFLEPGLDEAVQARAVAAHLGTEHTELYVTGRDMLAVLPKAPRLWDEPFGDSSQIPTACVCALAREQVTVALSGDGGDELFGGYGRYFQAGLWERIRAVPLPLRRIAAKLLRVLPPGLFGLSGELGRKVRRRLDLLTLERFEDFYCQLLSHETRPELLVPWASEPQTALTRNWPDAGGRLWTMTLLDTLAYLPDDILTKIDRAGMEQGLELRTPLLDHWVVEFAASLPERMQVEAGQGKRVLRELLFRHVPRALVERPKMGFGAPVRSWLENELKAWAADLLDPALVRRQGWLDPARVTGLHRDFLGGNGALRHRLWNVLMFQAWLEEWGA